MRIELVPAKPIHRERIARRMRAIDVAECRAFGRSPKQAIRNGLIASSWALTAVVDDQPEAMFGLSVPDLLSGLGRPWFLGTDVVERAPVAMVRTGRRVVETMHRQCRRLENWVSIRNVLAIEWLPRVGFTVEDEAYEFGGEEMVAFWSER
jgi:hypothetical protein